MEIHHQPVMVDEVIAHLQPVLGPDSTVIDCTVGSGGHAAAILNAGVRLLIAIDKDPDAIARSRERLKPWQDRIVFIQDDFRNILKIAMSHAPFGVDAIIADLGVSMDQLRRPERGFSFEREGPLDMRMNPWDSLTAEKIVNRWPYERLVHILRTYGEEPHAEKIAKAIIEARKRAPIRTTTQLADIVHRVVPRRGRLHPATRTFQALRIAVNRELERLDAFLVDAFHVLRVGGRFAVLAYHSLEDRTVKHVFARLAAPCRCGATTGLCVCEGVVLGQRLTKKPLRPSRAEVLRNPSARSARLRVIEKRAPLRFRDLVLRTPQAPDSGTLPWRG